MNSILGSVVPLAMFIYYWNILKTLWMKESHDLFPPPHPLNASPLKFTFYPPAENHLNDCCLGIIPFSPLPESKNWHIWGLGSAQLYMVSTHGHQMIEMDTFTPGKTNYNYMLDLGSSLYNQCNNLSQSWLCSDVKCVLQSPTMPFLEISNAQKSCDSIEIILYPLSQRKIAIDLKIDWIDEFSCNLIKLGASSVGGFSTSLFTFEDFWGRQTFKQTFKQYHFQDK